MTAGLSLPVPGTAASADVSTGCTGALHLATAFDTPAVTRGQVANGVRARNCANRGVSTFLVLSGRFLGPSDGTPPGCPTIDPSGNRSPSLPSSETAAFSSDGHVVAQATATVAIIDP